jgi:hypothetical protein
MNMHSQDSRDQEDLLGSCQCELCRHYFGEDRCAAFPEGIPLAILNDEVEHCHPFAGDRGIVFAPREG